MSKKLKPVAFYKRFNSITEIDNVEIPAVQRLLIKSHVDELKEYYQQLRNDYDKYLKYN